MRILVTRFSALGDVALLVPVLKNFTEQYPEHELMVVSRAFVKPLFAPLPVTFFAADLYGKHKGVQGLWRLYKEIKQAFAPELVLDMHAVLRSHLLGNFFKLSGVPLYRMDKGRVEKRALTSRTAKVFKPLKHTAVRYAEVFAAAGFDFSFDPSHAPSLHYSSKAADAFLQDAIKNPRHALGVAPFAKHQGKMWPAAKMKESIRALSDRGLKVLLFGGKSEAGTLEEWASIHPNITSIAGKFELTDELAIIKKLPLFVGMDSSNTHFAALVGTPVITIWGATHPHAGFAPLGENEEGYLQVPHAQLDCRPCSVFGNKPCWRGDYACMNRIDTHDFVEKVWAQYAPPKPVA